MEITIQLDTERAKKLAYLEEHSGRDPASLLAEVIDQAYQKAKPKKKNAYQIFEEFGLIGCMDSDSEPLPETDHPEIQEYLMEKRQKGTL
ncbi:MAG: hypothetical protein AAF810_19480 [Cyanobacteria bacterium P01_D01_bin.36]